MKSVIFLTSQTSATGFMQRILRTLAAGHAEFQQYFVDVVKPLGPAERAGLVPPARGHVLVHNNPPLFNTDIDFDDYRLIVNFRDTRDRLCNMYAWQFCHGTTESAADRLAREGRVRAMGIDNWVLGQIAQPKARNYYSNLFKALSLSRDAHVATYAQLCCSFDRFMDGILKATGFALTEAKRALIEQERPENIAGNSRWIGQKWSGSDLMPGRYRHELRPETVTALNGYFADTLRAMARHDPEFAELYLEGVGG